MSSIMTVSQLNRYISFRLKEDKNLHGILIRGEISNFTNHAKTGHLYFTVKDRESSIKAIMFNSMAARLKFLPSNGMSVIISANVQVFERDGVYQLYVNDMQPDGIGTLYLAFEQLKAKLSEEGIFDEEFKKPIPAYPQRIGIVTSIDAAALQDMLNIISRRYPVAEVLIFPCLVQGENAPLSICSSLKNADCSNVDVIIVGRGGGSLEDLMAFNSESVARCIFSCVTPVISAIGHETDTTISDFAADLRAATPSAAAEIAVPELSMLSGYINSLEFTLNERFYSRLEKMRQLLEIREHKLNAALPVKQIEASRNVLAEKEQRINAAFKNRLALNRALISEKIAALDNLSPLKIMNRGYSLIYKDEELVKSVKSLNKGDKIKIKLADGDATAVIESNLYTKHH